MDKSAQIIEYRIVVQSDGAIQVYAGDKRDYGNLNREALQEAAPYLEELDEAGLTFRSKLKNLGRYLYKAVFNGNVKGHFRENILRLVLADQEVFCRINLVFQENVDPHIISLPWELLFVPPDKEIFLGTHPQFSLSCKYEDWLTHPLSPQHAEKDVRLRVLFVHVHPDDLPGIGKAMVRKDIQLLEDAGQAEFHELMNPTARELHQEIVQYRPHVFHFLTHGRFDHKKGEFALLDSEGKTLWYDDQSFGDLFQSWKPQAVVLQACESGQLSEIKAFAGPAGSLMRQQVPAVVSMRYPIEQKHAWAFNAEFYRALAANEPIDFAVQKGRYALAISNDGQGHSSHEFAIPTLWMRSQSYSLFPTDTKQDETASACSVSSSGQPSHPADIRVYLDDILSEADELDTRYVDLSAVTTQPKRTLPEKFNWSPTLVPSAFRVLEQKEDAQKQENKLLDSIAEALAIHPRFVLLGAPGCGKTTTLKKLQSDAAKLAKQNPDAPIPLFFSLSRWPEEKNNIPALIHDILETNGLQPIHINRLLLLLDGLNEVSAQTYIPRIKLLEQWLLDHPKVSVIISCRQKHYQNNKRLSIPEVQIEPFDNERIKLFLNAYLGTESAQRLLPQLGPLEPEKRSPRDLIHLADNPYFLFMICYVYGENHERLPGSRGLLFQEFVHYLYKREKLCGLTRGLSAEELNASLSTLAFAMQKRRSATSVHLAWAEKQIPKNISSAALWELSRGASLVQFAKEERFVQFTHQLLLEYFAAEYLFQRLDNFPENIIKKPGFARHQRKGQPWDEVIYTLAGITEPNALLKKIAETDPFLAEDCFAHIPVEAEIIKETLDFILKRLIGFLESRSVEARRVTVAKLVTIGEATIPYLTKILQSKKRKHVVKRSALRVLAEFDNFDALYAVFSALDDTGWVRKDAQEILEHLDIGKIQILTDGINFSLTDGSGKLTELIQLVFESDVVRLEEEICSTLKDYVQLQKILDELKGENPKNKVTALNFLGELGNEDMAKKCLPLLQDESPNVRRTALDTLRVLGDENLAEECLPLLQDENPNVRRTALDALRVLGDENLATKCLSRLKHKDPNIRRNALNVLRILGNEDMAEKCLPLLKHKKVNVRLTALNALRALGNKDMAGKCLPFLQDESPNVRQAALNALCVLGNEDMAEKCLSLLKDESPNVRQAALSALGKLGNEHMAKHCLPLLQDESPNVRQAALSALGKLGNEHMAEHCLPLLKDEISNIRQAALHALHTLCVLGNEDMEKCLPLLKDEKPNVRQAALSALGKLGNEQTVGHCLPLLQDESSNVRQAALSALGKLGNEQTVGHCLPLLQDESSNVRQAALSILGKLGNEQTAEHCLPLLKDKHPNVKQAALTALGELGNEQTAEHYLPLLKDKYWNVRRAALTALGELGNEQTAEHCLPLLKDNYSNVRRVALAVIGVLGNKQMAEHCLPLLKDEIPGVRQAALTALGELGNEQMAEHCLPLLEDENPNVRKNAEEVIVVLQGKTDTQ